MDRGLEEGRQRQGVLGDEAVLLHRAVLDGSLFYLLCDEAFFPCWVVEGGGDSYCLRDEAFLRHWVVAREMRAARGWLMNDRK